MLALATLTFAVLVGHPSLAQRYLTRTYTEQDGLLNSKVADLAQDAEGRMWFLTRAGLTVYDGSEWRDIVVPTGLSGRDLMALEIDAQGGVWVVGTEPSSLSRLDGTDWHRVSPLPEDFGEFERWITSMAVLHGAGGQKVALGSIRHGVLIWTRDQWQHFGRSSGLATEAVHDVAAGGDVLYAATGNGLYQLEGDAWNDLTTRLGLPRGAIRALLLEDFPAEKLWVLGDEWIGYIENGVFYPVASDVRVPAYRPRHHLNVGIDGRGGLYFGHPAAAFHLKRNGQLERFAKRNGLLADGATAFLLDREENLWVSSFRGVSKVSSQRFATYDREHGLWADEVSAILLRPSGEIVLGHESGLSFLSDGGIRTLRLERTDLSADEGSRLVLDLTEDRQGNLWAALANHGLAKIRPGGEIEWWLGGTGPGRVDTVRADRGGQIWVGTRSGLFRVQEGQLQKVEALGDVATRRLIEGSSGTLFLATSSDGLYVQQGEAWSHHRGAEGPGSNSLFTVHEQADGTVWVGTDAGLLQLDRDRLRRPESKDLRIDRPVYFVTEDPHGRIWIGTDFGIRRWDGRSVREFTVREGLAGNSTNRAAFLVDSHGAMWIGTDRGVSRYQEEMEKQAVQAPRVGQLSLEVEGIQIPLDSSKSEASEPGDSDVKLDYTRSPILFQARALTLIDESRVKYRYQLEGLDEHWISTESSTRFETRYPILPPGPYRFRLQARNSESGWQEIASPRIVVAQPFWQRGWFYMLLAALVAGLGYSGQHYVSQRRYSRRLEDDVRVRTAALEASEQAILAERQRLAVTLSSIADGVIATDREGTVLLVNQAGEELAGWTEAEALGQPLDSVLPLVHDEGDEARRIHPVQAVLELGEPVRFPTHYTLRNREGNTLQIQLVGAPVRRVSEENLGVVLAFSDVSEQKRMEEERSRTQKLEAIGVLAGGIAHDFNNILTGIMGHLSLSRMIGLDQPKAHEHLEKAEKAVGRASGLARQLLTFARGGAPLTGPASISELVEEAAPFVLSGTSVRSEIDLDEDLWPVEIDQGQISQVLGNLLINAVQAMPEGGTVTLSGRNLEVEETTPSLRPGRYVHLTVRDQGVGIAPRHLRRVFDPYFTTKQAGSGLGLATAYSIMQKHGGSITVGSQLGVGTAFSLYIPASEAKPQTEEIRLDEVPVPGTGKILLMDDEQSVLNVLEEMLTHLGYQAACAVDGEAAIELYRQALESGDPFDLVILDLTVPGGMGGKEALQGLRAIDPRVHAIVSSGYSEDPVMSRFREYGLHGVLVKPYRLPDVARILREVFSGQ